MIEENTRSSENTPSTYSGKWHRKEGRRRLTDRFAGAADRLPEPRPTPPNPAPKAAGRAVATTTTAPRVANTTTRASIAARHDTKNDVFSPVVNNAELNIGKIMEGAHYQIIRCRGCDG